MSIITGEKLPTVDRCAFCPHPKATHKDIPYAIVCNECQEPCSYIYINVHYFEIDINAYLHRGEARCRICHLPHKSCAHHEEYHNERHYKEEVSENR